MVVGTPGSNSPDRVSPLEPGAHTGAWSRIGQTAVLGLCPPSRPQADRPSFARRLAIEWTCSVLCKVGIASPGKAISGSRHDVVGHGVSVWLVFGCEAANLEGFSLIDSV